MYENKLSKCLIIYNIETSKFKMPLLNILSFIQFQYTAGCDIIDYIEIKKDLGVTPMVFTLMVHLNLHNTLIFYIQGQNRGLV